MNVKNRAKNIRSVQSRQLVSQSVIQWLPPRKGLPNQFHSNTKWMSGFCSVLLNCAWKLMWIFYLSGSVCAAFGCVSCTTYDDIYIYIYMRCVHKHFYVYMHGYTYLVCECTDVVLDFPKHNQKTIKTLDMDMQSAACVFFSVDCCYCLFRIFFLIFASHFLMYTQRTHTFRWEWDWALDFCLKIRTPSATIINKTCFRFVHTRPILKFRIEWPFELFWVYT